MKKIIFFFFFPFFLFSAPADLNYCCGDGVRLSTVSSGSSWLRDPGDTPTAEYCTGYGILTSDNRIGSDVSRTIVNYNCSCASPKELVNGSCYSPCLEGEVRNDTGECVEEEPTNECNEGYTLTTGYTTLLPSRCNSCITNQTCLDAYTLRQMTDSEQQLCCIKFDNSDDEVEAPETPDNNATPLDLNPTNEILEDIRDDANQNADQLEQEEQETRARLEEVKEILAGIQSDSNENSTAGTNNQTSNTDREIQNDNSNANQAHQDQLTNQGKYDDIILNLRTVTPAINTMTANANANAEQAHTDSQNSDAQNQDNADRNHEDLEGIKEAIDNLGGGEDFENEFSTALEGLGQLDNMIQDSRETIVESFNGMIFDYTGLAPVFTATGDCVESFEVFGKTIELDFNFFSTAKFAFDIIFTLLLALMTFKVYFFIFVSLTNKA